MPLIGGQRPAQLRAIEAQLRTPANVIPGALVARGQTTAVIRCASDAVKLRAGKHEIDLPAGSAYLAAAKPEHLQAQLDTMFEFVRVLKSGEAAPVDCPCDLARYVLANANLLPVQSISHTPVLRHDGSIVAEPGYDPSTGIFYAPDEPFPTVPSEPSQDDARAALERLRHPFRGFPFVTDTDRDAVVVELLTLLTRHLMPRAPAFAHNAVEVGSGKTKLFDTVALIAIDTNAPLLNAEILDDETELRKCLTTLTLAAAPIVVFDNVVRGGQITSPGLSNYLTATVYGDRLLGSNTELKAATCTVLGVTGNAVEVAGDNVRRVLRIDLDAGVERPETREFDFDCEAEARRDRGELVVAALTLLRAHALAGWPPVPGRAALGSFEDWDRLVAGAIVYAGGADIVTLLAKTRLADPERDDLAEVLKMLEGTGATTPMKVGEIIHAVETQKTAGFNIFDPNRPADAWHAVLCRLSRDGQPNARKIGRYLSKNAGRIGAGLQLTMTIDNHEKANRYSVRPVTNAREDEAAGFAGFCGLSRPPFQSDVILS
jgi:putative DNA primase/helicase